MTTPGYEAHIVHEDGAAFRHVVWSGLLSDGTVARVVLDVDRLQIEHPARRGRWAWAPGGIEARLLPLDFPRGLIGRLWRGGEIR